MEVKRQFMVEVSKLEANDVALFATSTKVVWLKQICGDLNVYAHGPMVLGSDSIVTLGMAKKSIFTAYLNILQYSSTSSEMSYRKGKHGAIHVGRG